MENREIINIYYELVTELKLRHGHSAARDLIRRFRYSVNQEKLQLKRELLLQDRKKRRAIGICTHSNCIRKSKKGHSHCNYHIRYLMEWKKNMKLSKI